MVIDFHTHIFPDKIAKTTISALEKNSNGKAFTDGTVNGLISELDRCGVDIAVTLPVLTKPTQFDSVTKFALSINEEFSSKNNRIISFGGMHPQCDKKYEKMKYLKDNGFLGIKIHPDYQNTFIDDDGYVEIINIAKELDLIVVTHSGIDDGYLGEPVKCPPKLVKKVIEKTKHSKFVLGHFGAHKQWQEVYNELAGLDVYFDTAFTFYKIQENLFKNIVTKHGPDKILFASDCPWSDIKRDKERLLSFVMDKDVLDKIFYKNALKLLNIKG